ncbi:glycosyltransferase [Sphingobacterium deserti]|uniref:Group 1 glycosyl transferase n=1 Tax=Sphingobacterium deserti TaxID=1229276 RepID=A0A0B8T6B7_9SPHI|nr:glycosyltransferase [Sphingobacterium deserti]KGE12655.1 group 1 glycosyl transferase [Sphingobacterium deserti]
MTFENKQGIAFISTFPPRACGIATYATDLINSIETQFESSFDSYYIPLEISQDVHQYEFDTFAILDVSEAKSFQRISDAINQSLDIDMVCIQHEFGLFHKAEDNFVYFLNQLNKDIVLTFHTVLPTPTSQMVKKVRDIAHSCKKIIVMTQNSADILVKDYHLDPRQIIVVPHGTHLSPAIDKNELRVLYDVENREVLSTFGLLGPGKSIETTLEALPVIVQAFPEVLFLVLGMTHPVLLEQEGEQYRDKLEEFVRRNALSHNVRFVNEFLSTVDLLSYLQLTDVYLFTSKDPTQAVSGTFAYALASGCPIVSTPIPHAQELLKADMGRMIDFGDAGQLAEAVSELLRFEQKEREKIRNVNIQKTVATSWQNSALAHVQIFNDVNDSFTTLRYSVPTINLEHVKRMTTPFGFIQFAEINTPDLQSGYALDDNARALVAILYYYDQYRDLDCLKLVSTYLHFIGHCIQEDGTFLNYVDTDKKFTKQNFNENLEDANGRAVWALGELLSRSQILPANLVNVANDLLRRAAPNFLNYQSTRSMAFTIKGLSYLGSEEYNPVIIALADRLVAMFTHESSEDWRWYESYLTYANSLIPEALLLAFGRTSIPAYKEVAYRSFHFLIDKIFLDGEIHVISNKGWAQRGGVNVELKGGEQPVDVAYTILALDLFYKDSGELRYREMAVAAFEWFLGRNHLKQIVYNPVTGGCFDGLEELNVNINQGAESTLSYLLARLKIGNYAVKIS